MSDTGWVSPGTTSNDTSIGTESWTDTNNAKTSDNNYATVYLDNLVAVISDYSVKLVKGGTIGGNNKATDTELTTTDNTITYGGSSNLWGLTLSYSDVNSTNFGVVYSATEDESNVISNYLKCTNFGFSIPTDATINGIEVNIEQSVAGNYCDTQVDCVQIKVYYTETETPIVGEKYALPAYKNS